jgi:SPP1 family predicted phage head-tail adaptor
MQAGKLWHEITIEQRNDTRDLIGASVASWATYLTTYAELLNSNGVEVLQAKQVNSFIDSAFKIRWDSGVRSNMRIVFKSRNYNIEWIDNIEERDKEMILYCRRQEDQTNG